MADHTITLSDAGEAAWTQQAATLNADPNSAGVTIESLLSDFVEGQGQIMTATQQAQAVTAIGIALAADPTLTADVLTSAGLPSDPTLLGEIAATGALQGAGINEEPPTQSPPTQGLA